MSGALRFAAYAYPPNALGYCGPDASHQLLEQVAAGVDDPDLRRLARGLRGRLALPRADRRRQRHP